METKNKNILYLGAIVVIVFGIFIFLKSNKTELKIIEEKKPQIKVEYVDQAKLPPELPTDLPLEENAPMVRNEIVTVRDGEEVQNVRMYYSKKTVAQNFDIYKKYLVENSWVIKTEVNDKNFASILAEKEGKKGVFQISVSKNSITSDISVQLNVVVRS